jgi:hypothetical protein
MVLRTQQRCCARKLTAVADSVRPSLPLAQARARGISLFLAGLAAELSGARGGGLSSQT